MSNVKSCLSPTFVFSPRLALTTFTSIDSNFVFQFGFRKWKGNVTERPIEDQSDIIKELYSNLTIVKPQEGPICLCA